VIVAESIHPDALVHLKVYTPGAVKLLMVAVGLLAGVIVAVPGLPLGTGVHVPVPTAAIVADPPGNVATQLTVLSGPALGRAVTVTVATSVQVPTVHVKV
jgi:hypothetical protein